MIKASLFNLNESFFGQSVLLLFPILIFSASFEFSLLIGGLGFILIYLTSLIFISLEPKLERVWLSRLLLSLAIISGLMVSAGSFYFYSIQFKESGYLINLFFISHLSWQKNLLLGRGITSEKINEKLLPSLFWVLIVLWLSALLRELLGTGSLLFFGEEISILSSLWTLPVLKQSAGGFLLLFLSALALKVSPENYPKEYKNISAENLLPPSRTLGQTIAERTSRLEQLLEDSSSNN